MSSITRSPSEARLIAHTTPPQAVEEEDASGYWQNHKPGPKHVTQQEIRAELPLKRIWTVASQEDET